MPPADPQPAFDEAGTNLNVDPMLLRAIAQVESGGEKNPDTAVSSAGALGRMQVMPANLKHYNVSDPSDPRQNIHAGAALLDEALTAANGNVPMALRIYQGGPDQSKWGPNNAAYPGKVAAAYQALAKAPQAAAPSPAAPAAPDATDAFLSGTTGGGGAKAAAPAPDATDTFLAGKEDTGGSSDIPTMTVRPGAKPSMAADNTSVDEYGNLIPVSGPTPDSAATATSIGRVGTAIGAGVKQGWQDTQPLLTQRGQDAVDSTGPIGRFLINPAARLAGAVPAAFNALAGGAAAGIATGADEAGVPALGRDLNMLAQVAPLAHIGTGVPLTPAGEPAPAAAGPRFVSEHYAPPAVPGGTTLDRLNQLIGHDNAEVAGQGPAAQPNRLAPAAMTQAELQADVMNPPGSRPAAPGAAGAQVTTEPIPEPTPAEKATALQKMVGQSATDRLSPQGRDDATYFPGVVRPEAMRDFSDAPEGKLSSALEHKALYNTDSNYHDQFDAQVKANNSVMTDGTTLPDGTRVDGLKDLIGDANTREAAMNDARDLMPGSVNLFTDEKPVSIQPVADTINKILAGPYGKIDGVANTLKKILPKLQDADGNPETMPSQIKGIFDDINNKLYDKSPTNEGNEARQASTQLKQVKAAVSDVIGGGLPGTKWTDYLSNLSGALGQVSKQDFMQKYLTGSKSLWGSDGMLQFNKVRKMLDDIQQHSADQTGGAKEMTMPEINMIEAARNELAAKDLLDKRAGVRGSPTVQLGNAAGFLGSGPLGAAVGGAANLATHAVLLKTTGGLGNAAMLLHNNVIKPARAASKVQQAANALAATKNRLLDTSVNRLAD